MSHYECIRKQQRLLKLLGLDVGPIDGIEGQRTKDAYRAAIGEPEAVDQVISFVKPNRPVERVFIHCSASDDPDHDNAQTMDEWHKARGWSGIGYHYFIRKNGLLEIGRDIAKVPAAQGGKSVKPGSVKGGNSGTIAICLHGLEKDQFTDAQFKTLRKLCDVIDAAYEGRITFHGHREVAFKECPVFDYRQVLGLDAKGRLP